MNSKNFARLLTLLYVLTLVVLPTCVLTTANATDGHYPVTITNQNYAGEKVEYTYEKAPEKVIVVYQSSIETMIALGLEDHVLASYGLDNAVKDEWKDGFDKMNYDASVFAPDKETVTLMEPDMIFSWGSYFGEKMIGEVDAWNAKGVGTYMKFTSAPVSARILENEYLDILNIGKIFNVEEKAEALVNNMKAKVADTLALTKDSEPVSVIVIQPRKDGDFTNRAANSLAGDMVTSLGGTMAKPEGSRVNREELIACNPDVIFTIYMPRDGRDFAEMEAEYVSMIKDDAMLQSLDAVKNNRVYAIQLGEVYASGPRTADGLAELAAGMYPSLMEQ